MLISIITITYNSQKTLTDTINSVMSQSYKNIEHIIIDGNSFDYTREIIEKYRNTKKKFPLKVKYLHDQGIYDSMNKGLSLAKGKFVTFLNSDDIFHNNNIVQDVATIIKNKNHKIFYGDVTYFRKDPKFVTRYYSGKNFKFNDFANGLMPPHPGCFIETKLHKKIKFDTKFKVAGDFDLLLRIFKEKKKSYYLNKTLVRMRSGGASGENFITYIKSTFELLNSCKKRSVQTNLFKIVSRIPLKLSQFLFYDTFKLNKDYSKPKLLVKKLKRYSHVKIINNTKKIPFKKNFILSAMNLAFLGSFFDGKLCLYKELIHWPDGIFSRSLSNKITKMPGRDLLTNLKLPKNIDTIHILGNANKLDILYLEKNHKNLKIKHSKLPYGSTKNIAKSLPLISYKELVLITLPTPKQEQLAYILSNQNKKYKIICIGASLAMVSGNEKPIPAYLYTLQLEFLWRLQNDTRRRIVRLIQTLTNYILGLNKGYMRRIKVSFPE